MNEHESAARGQRAETCYNEFIGPELATIRASYTARIADIAVKELDPKARTEKITALSFALRILDNVNTGIVAIVEDGKLAEKNMLRADEVERMTPSKRKLFNIAPSY